MKGLRTTHERCDEPDAVKAIDLVRGCARSLRTSRRCWITAFLFGVLGLVSTPAAWGQQDPGEAMINREYPLKALFLYNFGSYIEWPTAAFPTADGPFVIGVLGGAPLDIPLRQIADSKQIGGRRIAVERYATAAEVKGCHILFIGRDVNAREQQAAVARVESRPTLVVGETTGFAGRGGGVNFYVESNRIRFEINLEAVKNHQLKASAKLLTLAKIVGGQP